MKSLTAKTGALRASVLFFAVLFLALGCIACSPKKSGDGAQWGTMGKGSAQKPLVSSRKAQASSSQKSPSSQRPQLSVLDLPLDGTLRGTVKDEEGQPLQGVTVYALIPDDPHVFGNVTDAAGQYEIKFPKKWATEVQFSMLGKEKVTLPIGKKKKIDVVLKDAALELDPGLLDQPTGAFRIVQSE